MNEIIQIKCPFDGTILSVRNQPGIERKNVTCPICKNSYPFRDYRRVMPGEQVRRGPTPPPMPGAGGYGGQDDGGHTEIPQLNMIIGRVTVEGRGSSYQLKPGRNVIGRQAQRSQADFMIDTGESRQMSREHIIIDVANEPGRGFVHRVSLFKERVNDTFVGKDKIFYGDRMVLNHGDMIRMPDAVLRFELPEEDATQF